MPDYWLPRSPKKACVIVSRLAAGRRDNFKAAGVGEGCADLYIGDSEDLESEGIGRKTAKFIVLTGNAGLSLGSPASPELSDAGA